MPDYRIDNILPHTDFSPYTETAKTKAVEEEKTGGGVSFGDILDIVNPLQHIPVVSTVYRSETGDKISPGSRIIGGAIFGQLFGLIASVVNVVVEAVTGKDIGDHVMTALKGDANKIEDIASSEEYDPAVLLATAENSGSEHKAILDASNRIMETDKSNPVIHSEGIKKYAEAKEALESKKYGIESYTSIMA
ncbi:MAG: hypothetical protein A2077_05980 [Nitrospirae bacterium GWC2_46_6]|nr:MAG: hypothetical protein A2077_05980 [Nitrospirae bacterium GWC2_46_6]OGW21782.1 MAG: hypothetical protein A2Z82_00310 [Nitrospirae bacterium GWA2_46_11]OGW25029.1 MAG: hypothetical protein A2X55_06080 [Nitrospirae bacterium GWB2_47_37]HAK88883.1 hypothetical protein [Nitrospiraceae bacterium]HCL80838.1 hypothetical protein [Nitrospiraceae bacterium]